MDYRFTKTLLALLAVCAIAFASCEQNDDDDDTATDTLQAGATYYGIAKTISLDVADNTVITEPEQEKVISLWEENVQLSTALNKDGATEAVTVAPFCYGGRISVPQFTVHGAEADGAFVLSEQTAAFSVTPIFLSAEESSNGEADEQTNTALNCIVDRFTLHTTESAFSARFRLNFIGQNPTAKKSRASDTRVEANYMAIVVTVTGTTDRASATLARKRVYTAETPLTVSGTVASRPVLHYTVLQADGAITVRMNAFSYSPKMRIGDIYMTAPIGSDGVIALTASSAEPLYAYTANDEKIMPIKITALSGTFTDDEQSLAFSFIPGSMPLAITVEIDSFSAAD